MSWAPVVGLPGGPHGQNAADDRALDRAAEIFGALTAASRLRLLRVLAQGDATVTQLVEATGLSQPLTSQHLKVLRGLRLVEVRRVGRSAIYSLKDEHVANILFDALEHAYEETGETS